MATESNTGREKGLGITAKKETDFSEWYTQVLTSSGFIDYSDVSGAIVLRPDSYFAWESVQRAVDALFKRDGIQNACFPSLIPEKLLNKEEEHIAGFSAEVAWVTEAGSSKLEERLAVRPTSETIMYPSYAKWIRSWRDLPMRLNQWNNVVRWEFKHAVPLLRTREFLWNEGHSVFATQQEADAERDAILGIYVRVLKDYMALPCVPGRKTDSEKFAGAVASYSLEHLLPSGKVIQGPAWHSDGQNFSKAFDITFLNKAGAREYAYQNTYAISTRELGVMVATHSDNKGLVMPPFVSRIQVAIVPIYGSADRDSISSYAKSVEDSIKRLRVHTDLDDAYSPGWKFNQYELMGVPIRLEIGRREAEGHSVTVVRRDTGTKAKMSLEGLEGALTETLVSINDNLYARALSFMDANTRFVESMDSLAKSLESGGFVQAPWCGDAACEAVVKEKTGAKSTNMPFSAQGRAGGKKCVVCGKDARHVVNFARSY